MRDPIRGSVRHMVTPSRDIRAAAARGGHRQGDHDALLGAWECLSSIEVRQPSPAAVPMTFTIAAWNIERCKRVTESAKALRDGAADIVLATEMDFGMARSGQRHTTRDLAAALGLGYAFGVEFVELGVGDAYETSLFTDVPNDHGLHGNAILSRYPIENAALLPLDDGGRWFTQAPKNDGQLRIGGRMAMAAQIGGITFVSVHYESESDAEGRAEQTRRMLDLIASDYGRGPCVIGGDLNTAAFADAQMTGSEILSDPMSVEPAFAAFASAGFDWQPCNTSGVTTRAAPGRAVRYPLKKLDWLFVRGVHASDPAVHPAVSDLGDYLSDHELLTAKITR